MKKETTSCRWELHTKNGVLYGSERELKLMIDSLEGEYSLYKIIPSSMNVIRVSKVSWINVEDYVNIIRLSQTPMSTAIIAAKYKLGVPAVNRISKDEFHILNKQTQ